MKKRKPSKEELELLYAREGNTISSLAREYSTSNPTMRKWLLSYGIVLKTHLQASREANSQNKIKVKPSKETLLDLYQNHTIDSLEDYFGVGQQTIYEWLNDFEIPIRTLSNSLKKSKADTYRNIQFSYETLDQNYDRSKSINCLAKKLNVSRSHIRSQLIKHSIKIEPIEPSWRSKEETELYKFLKHEFPCDEWSNNDKTIISPYELDIVNKTQKLAIEYCGLYWHSEGSSGKKQNYHVDKYIKGKNAGYRLITIFSSDDQRKIRSFLLKLMGKTCKIGARKTKVSRIETKIAMDFHKTHHLHGSVGAKFHYGLYFKDQLLMVASFGKNRFSSTHEYECTRITSHSNITVVGGVSKLIKHFIDTEKPQSIVTFSDLRFGEGNVYTKCGFSFVSNTPSNYWYSKKYFPELFSRVKFQKHKLSSILETYDPLKTEFENMLDNSWDRIWDCGNAKYEWINPDNKKGGDH